MDMKGKRQRSMAPINPKIKIVPYAPVLSSSVRLMLQEERKQSNGRLNSKGKITLFSTINTIRRRGIIRKTNKLASSIILPQKDQGSERDQGHDGLRTDNIWEKNAQNTTALLATPKRCILPDNIRLGSLFNINTRVNPRTAMAGI